MLKKIQTQGLFLLSFLAVSVFLSGCQNQMEQCELPSIENKNWQFRSLGSSSFTYSTNRKDAWIRQHQPVLWNNKIFVTYPEKETLTVFQLDEQFKATVWKKFPLKKVKPNIRVGFTGVIGSKLFFEYFTETSPDNIEEHVLLIDSEGGMQSLSFPKRIMLLPSNKENDFIFSNFMSKGLASPYITNLFYTLDESFKLKEVDKKGTLLFNSGQEIPSDNGMFFLSFVSPSATSVKEPVDHSVVHLYHMNKSDFEIKEMKSFAKQYSSLIHCNQEGRIRTKAQIDNPYYDHTMKKLYFSMIVGSELKDIKNRGSETLSQSKSYLGSYDLNSHTLNLISANYNTPTYFLGKINNKLVLLDYIDHKEKNKVMLKFTELISEGEEEVPK